jgi:hypothetical protein
VFNRVYRLEIQSIMLIFSTLFVSCCPSNLLSDWLFPPPPPSLCTVNKYTVYTYTVCKGWEAWGDRWVGGFRQIKHLPQNPFTGKFRERHLTLHSISLIFLRVHLNKNNLFQVLNILFSHIYIVLGFVWYIGSSTLTVFIGLVKFNYKLNICTYVIIRYVIKKCVQV